MLLSMAIVGSAASVAATMATTAVTVAAVIVEIEDEGVIGETATATGSGADTAAGTGETEGKHRTLVKKNLGRAGSHLPAANVIGYSFASPADVARRAETARTTFASHSVAS